MIDRCLQSLGFECASVSEQIILSGVHGATLHGQKYTDTQILHFSVIVEHLIP